MWWPCGGRRKWPRQQTAQRRQAAQRQQRGDSLARTHCSLLCKHTQKTSHANTHLRRRVTASAPGGSNGRGGAVRGRLAGADDGLLYVCDRGNQRIQIFQKDGTFVSDLFVKTADDDGPGQAAIATGGRR